MRLRTVVVLVAIVLAVVIGGAVAMLRRGFSARDEPTAIERSVARMARQAAVPASLRARRNPVVATPAVLAEARAHFADHCALCHGNDGRGKGGVGATMYPRAPDMTLAATQSLSDGELFAIIENGVRLTGMPAFGDGTKESAESSWKLVHFIHHLPRLSAEEIAQMEALNPRSAEEWRQMEAEQSFLAGGSTTERH